MAKYSPLFSIFARIDPKIYDIIPRGPQRLEQIALRGGEAMLNPQPLPPKEAYLVASVELAHDVARAAAIAEAAGGSSSDMLSPGSSTTGAVRTGRGRFRCPAHPSGRSPSRTPTGTSARAACSVR